MKYKFYDYESHEFTTEEWIFRHLRGIRYTFFCELSIDKQFIYHAYRSFTHRVIYFFACLFSTLLDSYFSIIYNNFYNIIVFFSRRRNANFFQACRKLVKRNTIADFYPLQDSPLEFGRPRVFLKSHNHKAANSNAKTILAGCLL